MTKRLAFCRVKDGQLVPFTQQTPQTNPELTQEAWDRQARLSAILEAARLERGRVVDRAYASPYWTEKHG